MRRMVAALLVIALSVLAASCFEGEDDPFSPGDEDAPTAEILSPAGGSSFQLGSTIRFAGTGVDPQDGILGGASLVWTVDHRDTLGTGDSVVTNELREGPHTIVLTATDSDGKDGSDRIGIEVTAEDLSLESIWPNGDGSSWSFDYTFRLWYDGYSIPYWPTAEDVPDIPTLDEVEDLLKDKTAGGDYETMRTEYVLEFAGDTTTMSGVTAQNLRETLTSPPDAGAISPVSKSGSSFLIRLCAARPDLIEKVKARFPRVEVDAELERGIIRGAGLISDLLAAALKEPVLVHGYAWEKTEDWIGTYGDVDLALAWKFLERDLRTGHEFIFQLVPSLADDVYLHCRVLRNFTANTGLGAFDGSIECLYVIDYGIWTVEPGPGVTAVYTRIFDYGSVIYSPGFGPVYSYERIMVSPGDPPSPGIGDMEIILDDAVIRR